MQRATVQFIEDAAADDNKDFRYVLVPFNDPGEHFRVREVAKGELSHSLSAKIDLHKVSNPVQMW